MNRDNNYYLKSPTQELPSSQSRGIWSQSLAERGKYRPTGNQHQASRSNGHQIQGNYYERKNQIKSDLLQTSQYSSEQVDGAYGVSDNHYERNNQTKSDLLQTSLYSSGQVDGAYGVSGNYYERNNQINSDLLQTSQYSSEQVDGAYGVSGNYYERNNQINSDLLQTSQYSSEQVDGAYGVSGNYYERNNQIKSDLLQTSQYSSGQVDGAYGVSGNYYERNNQIKSDLLQTSLYSSGQVDGAYGVSDNHYERNNQIKSDLLQTSQYSSGQVDGAYGVSDNHYERNNQIKSDLLQTSLYSSGQVDGAYGVSGNYYERNNQIKSDLLQTSLYSSGQVDGAYGVSDNHYERNNQIKSDLLQTSQYSSGQVDGAYGVSDNHYERNNQIKSDLLQTSLYSSGQVDGAYGVSEHTSNLHSYYQYDLWNSPQFWEEGHKVELRAKEQEKQNINAYQDQWQIQSNIWNNNLSGFRDVDTSNAMYVKQEYGQSPKRDWKNAFGDKDANTYINSKKQKLNPDASVYVPFTNSAVKVEPPDVSIGAVAISVATSTEVKPPWHSLYIDSIWKIICRNCYFVSEYWGLEDHTCSHNDDILSETSHRQCDTCLMPLRDGETLKDHQKSRLHMLFMINRQFDSQVELLLEYYCYYCKIQSFSDKEHFQHTISESHLTNFQLLYPVINSFCVTCNLYFDSEGKDIHLASRVHLIQSIFNINWYTSKQQKEMYYGCTFCIFCNEDCKANKYYLRHISSYQHSCNELQNKIVNTHIRNFQYIIKIEKGFKCMLCNVLIPSEDLVPIHLNIENHIINMENFEDSKMSNQSKVVTVIKKAMPFDPCKDCRTKQRRCDHIYKDYSDYLTYRMEYVMLKFCFLCNAPNTETHELSDLHSKLSENLFYCQTCDKTYPLLLKDYHIKGYFHKKTIKKFGIKGNPNKCGIKQPSWNCKVCNFTLNNSENEIMYHLDSTRHNNSFKRFLTEDTIIECKLCRFVSRESDKYNDHIMSKEHLHNECTLKQEQSENYCYVCDNSVLKWKEHTDCPLHLLNLNKLKNVC